ncbi:MAG: hypothetical protein DME84_01880 [Verrucomicrobia bacterium]|nr:MAG: hypothetical protein DME84_01880 [Verrucomicrobiota bacterium]PYL31534.1 MAG: hypothetical protein DMF39_02465 [Verrucomicrobiota bacterium]
MQSKIPARICKVAVTILLLSAAASLAEPTRAKVAIATYAPRPKLPWPPAEVIMMHLSATLYFSAIGGGASWQLLP